MRKENGRTDRLTRQVFPKEELFRFVKRDGEYILDEAGTLGGRGFYLHKDEATLHKAVEKHLFERLGKAPLSLDALKRAEELL